VLREQEPPSEPPPTSALEQVERAERRLEERSAVRGVERERILARRARWDRWRLPLRVLGLGVAGAVVFLVTLQAAGGDLSDLPGPLATLIVVVELVAPGAIAARLTRAEGWPVAVSLGVCVFAIELALVFGVGLLLLGLGPE
jgi:hypothetical protein